MNEKDKQLNPAVAASKEKTLDICKYLSDKKASSIVYIDVESKTSLCDYFVICSGRSSTQVKSMAENLEEKMEKERGLSPRRREGVREGRWAVLDYEDVIVHIFNDEERDFYRLERLWEDGKNLTKYED
ncbi:MAG: ribosome silencing factor [Clostridia bacterium]|nr:ribosome silencing factor [Clostridia bacterium]